MVNQSFNQKMGHATSLLAEALSILLSLRNDEGETPEALSLKIPKNSSESAKNVLAEVPPFQAKIVRALANLPSGQATSDELAKIMGMTANSFKGSVRGSGRNKDFTSAVKYLYDIGWKDGLRLYILRNEGREAVEADLK